MAQATASPPVAAQAPVPGRQRRLLTPGALAGIILAAVAVRIAFGPAISAAAVQSATTIFVAIVFQALPFLVLGVVISGAIAAFVTPAMLARLVPRRRGIAVPAAGLAGALLPGCECGSVPVAGRLVERGCDPAAALTFLLSAPAINPVVMVATAVAFPGRPEVVLARFLASLATSVIVGLVWGATGLPTPLQRRSHEHLGASRWEVLTGAVRHDFLHAGGFLVLGGAGAAMLQTVIPRSSLTALGRSELLAVATMAVLAVALAMCSEADAFVASSLTTFPITARLVFLVVGPAVDLKLIALQSGTFGGRFAARFAPLTFVVSICCALLVGRWLL